MKAWLTRDPWRDTYELRLGYQAGKYTAYAKGITDHGDIIWENIDAAAEVPVFLLLREDVVEALIRSALEVTQASDATVEALKDARTIRDRLLVLVEKGWES